MFSSFSGGGLWGTELRGWLGDDEINEGMGEIALVKPAIKNQSFLSTFAFKNFIISHLTFF